MSETESFVDPVFLARFGLSRQNVLDYFLHPLNPFRTQANTSNEVLAMQGIAIGTLIQHGTSTSGGPLSPCAAEDEYNAALGRLTGEQYELLPPAGDGDTSSFTQPSDLFTIRHIIRSSPSSYKILGIYYCVHGGIYKSPAVRSIMKTNVTRVLDGLRGAEQALSPCAKYHPSVGYVWVFENKESKKSSRKGSEIEDDGTEHLELVQLARKRKRRTIVDNRRPGQRTAAEEEGIRASEAMDQILVRLSKSTLVATTTSDKVGSAGARKNAKT
jgi:hypothetical protein